jgi:hypothetical protein
MLVISLYMRIDMIRLGVRSKIIPKWRPVTVTRIAHDVVHAADLLTECPETLRVP